MNNHLNDEQLINYAYYTLTDTQRETMDLHLAVCTDCRARLAEVEALQRRVHYRILTRRGQAKPSARMSFTAISPRLKRSRRLAMFIKQSNQLVSGAVILVVLVALAIVLVILVNNIGWPAVDTPVIEQPVANLVEGVDQPAVEPVPIGELQWKFETEKDIISSPTVVMGVIYFGSNDHHLYAVDSQTGQELWRFDTGSPVLSSPAVAEGVVYVGSGCLGYLCGSDTSQSNYLFAVDSQTGREIWRFEADMGVASSPVIVDGVVYVGSYDQHLYAVDSQTGQELWRFATEDCVKSSPTVVDDTVYFGSGCFEGVMFDDEHPGRPLYAVDSQTGQEKWRVDTGGPVESRPAVVEGVVYFGSHDRQLYAVDRQTGQIKWQFKTLGLMTSSPAVADGLVYVTSRDGNLYAVDSQTGQEIWRFKTNWGLDSSPRVATGVVYFGSGSDGYLYAVDARTGRELWKVKADEAVYTSPTVANGVVYFGSEDNHLYAVR